MMDDFFSEAYGVTGWFVVSSTHSNKKDRRVTKTDRSECSKRPLDHKKTVECMRNILTSVSYPQFFNSFFYLSLFSARGLPAHVCQNSSDIL